MLTDKEVMAIAARVVAEAKRTSRVDQGSLKRSIAFTYVRGKLVFRELYYGAYNYPNYDSTKRRYVNGKLVVNRNMDALRIAAEKIIPKGLEYKINYTKLGGQTVSTTSTLKGKGSSSDILGNIFKVGTSAIRNLIASNKAKAAARAKRLKDGET